MITCCTVSCWVHICLRTVCPVCITDYLVVHNGTKYQVPEQAATDLMYWYTWYRISVVALAAGHNFFILFS